MKNEKTPPMDRFIDIVKRFVPDITPTGIADAIWLAGVITASGKKDPTGEAMGRMGKFPDRPDLPMEQEPETGSPDEPSFPVYPRIPGLEDGKGIGPGMTAHPIRAAGVPALPGRLEILRALGPLKRRVPSLRDMEIDPEATANRMADARIHWPVVRPKRKPWLHAVLVVEDSPSMAVWEPAVRELNRMLAFSGIFAGVRQLTFREDLEKRTIRLATPSGIPVPLRSPAAFPGRSLVIVISDCVSRAWWDGTVTDMFETWETRAMTAILHVLPEYLWRRTGLGPHVFRSLQSPGLAPVNRRLSVRPVPEWLGLPKVPENGLKIPVICPEPSYPSRWSAAMGGNRELVFPGVIFKRLDKRPPSLEPPPAVPIPPAADPDALLEAFRDSVSPEAERLAVYLAAAPLTLPVMRLVQAVMLPESRLHHLAEVMLSGLVYRVSERDKPIRPEEVLYEFVEGIRDRLLASGWVSETVRVLELVFKRTSGFLDANSRKPMGFGALIPDPSGTGPLRVPKESRPFARVLVSVLKRLGGAYAEKADALAEVLARADDGPGPGDDFDLPSEEIFSLDHGRVTMRFLFIRPGTFMMGSTDEEWEYVRKVWGDEDIEKYGIDETRHEVTLTRGYYLQETPVTVGQWKVFVRETGYETDAEKKGDAWGANETFTKWEKRKRLNWKNPGFPQEDDHPVVCVSWNDAKAFIDWLNNEKVHQGKGIFHFPTEAQWEYACRAGTETPFWTGSCLDSDQANYDGTIPYPGCEEGEFRKGTTSVDTFDPNPWGLRDMHGNALEWCRDWYARYPNRPVTDPHGPDTGRDRVLRGGSWGVLAVDCRSASRFLDVPSSRVAGGGLRLAFLPGQ